jgi:hypothetical protein
METLLTGATSRVETAPVHLSRGRGGTPPHPAREPGNGQGVHGLNRNASDNTQAPKNVLAAARTVWGRRGRRRPGGKLLGEDLLARGVAEDPRSSRDEGMNPGERPKNPSGRS